MMRTWPLAKIAVVILLAVLASTGLMFPLQAYDEGRTGPALPFIKYADGSRIHQVFFQPPKDKLALPSQGPATVNWIQGLSEKQVPLGESGYKLRLKLVTRLRSLAETRNASGRSQPVSRETPTRSEKLAVYDFDLYCDDLPVATACRTVMVKDGRPVAIRDRNSPAGLKKPTFPMKIISQNTAWSVVSQNARATFAQLYPGKTANLVVSRDTPADPAERLVLWPDQRAKVLLPAWTMTVRSSVKTQPFLRRYWVDARTPAHIFDFEDLVFYDLPVTPKEPFFSPRTLLNLNRGLLPLAPQPTIPPVRPTVTAPVGPKTDTGTEIGITAMFPGGVSGSVTGTMWETSPYRRTVSRPLPSVEISVSRPVGIQAVALTDGLGRYTLQGVSGLATVRASLSGPACKIIDDQAGPKNDDFAKYTHDIGGGNVDVDYYSGTTEEAKLAQTSAYYSVNQAFEFVKEFLPDRPIKLPRMPTYVNLDSSCNAYYDRSDGTLNFFRATVEKGVKGCPNTAYRDVVFHEYGHAVDDELGGILDGAYSEGFGDALTLLLTRSPYVGQDFYGLGQHLRDSSKVFSWTKVKGGEIHDAGQAYSGFCWDLVQRLQSIYGPDQAYEIAKQLIMGAAVQNPKDIPDAVSLSFFVDAQLYPNPSGGGSIHVAQLKAAAQSRDLPIPKNFLNPSLAAY